MVAIRLFVTVRDMFAAFAAQLGEHLLKLAHCLLGGSVDDRDCCFIVHDQLIFAQAVFHLLDSR